MTSLRAGAGRSEIEYPDGVWPLDGYTHVHDPLSVRVLLLADGDERVAWAVVDQTSLAPAPLAAVRDRLADVTGVAAHAVVVSVSHTFSAPHLSDTDDPGMRLAWIAVLDAVQRAGSAALAALAPVVLRAGTGRCGIAVNRDIETAEGWDLGRDECGFTDDTLTVIRFDGLDGSCRALLVSIGVQPSVLDGSLDAAGGRAASADLAGQAMTRLEQRYGGAVALFLIGAAGDQSPALTAVRTERDLDGRPVGRRDAADGGHLVAELLGERLADAATVVAEHAAAREVPSDVALTGGSWLAAAQEQTPREWIRPTRSTVYRPAGRRALPWRMLRVADIAIVGVQPELSAMTGRRIRARSPFAHTIVATMVDGGAKYLPEQDAFDRFTYEALSSYYARGTAEELEEVLLIALEREAKRVGAAAIEGRRSEPIEEEL